MVTEIEKLLTKGLQQGFAGGTVMLGVKRGDFYLKSSHLEGNGGIYHDEWIGDRSGSGQEIVQAGDTVVTRVYAGGTIPSDELEQIGISTADVMDFLKKHITENGEKIRLYTNFEPEHDGDWQYSYRVLGHDSEIPLTLGREEIKYKDKLVFVHIYIISPID